MKKGDILKIVPCRARPNNLEQDEWDITVDRYFRVVGFDRYKDRWRPFRKMSSRR